MNILTVDNITKAYGERQLFRNASFFLEAGEKAGVIGINGTGKSTLLKIMAGLEEPDEGRVITANHCMVRFLPQDPHFEESETVLEAVLRDNRTEMNESYIVSDAKAMLNRLGVTDLEKPCGQLSGGQRKRLALVSALLSPAEILVLDEPTNHLDNEMSDWLEDTLKKRKGAVVMVTHDRYFLDSVTQRIIEIDKGNVYSYSANYAGYLELKMQREEMEQASQRKRESILRNELAWVMRGARARSTKQKARLERYEELRDMAGFERDGQVEMSSVGTRLGRTTVELHHICKSYADKSLIEDFTYLFLKNDRVGFIGPNGSGKTTLMKIILGEVQPDSGHVELGQTVKIGYYAQEIGVDEMKPSQRVIDYIRDVAEFVDTDEGKISAARMLERFLFMGEDQYGLLGKLSGGERRRLYLLKILMGAPNVLILDEPTNDLDIATLRILEDFLDRFQGIVIVVSHDRYFLDRTVRRIFAMEEGRFVQYEGGYTDHVNRKKEIMESAAGQRLTGVDPQAGNKGKGAKGGIETPIGTAAEAKDNTGNKDWKSGRKRKLKFTYQEQKEHETIEGDIAALEEEVGQLDRDMLRYASDFVRLNELTERKEAAERALEEKMDRWMYLEDLAARIENGETVDE
ncbi:MAG: ABC-F family ATP-binding cassette domain-containing protein [Lachnospiraceae bacterium]|nr:ABC-F family ATP-binding cassette domain-containing protein [Butyrivibrio sp.]MCM1342202.1 ABC-F family ATP-binding cassette domain-containing protein [Muribaculaceae bacterium]MCM1409223.1 ABC-F family ATP-binding cassette domain-containing protein [Lachnospiraceae bacterium]